MDSVSVGKQLETLLAELKNIRTDIGSMNLRFDGLDQKLNSFISKTEVDIADVRKDVNQVEKSQRFLSEQYEKHCKEQDNIIKQNSQLKEENGNLLIRIKNLEKELKDEKMKRNKQEQHDHLRQVEISGISLQDGENCKEIVLKVAQVAKCNIKLNEIDVAHRLGSGAIITEFVTRTARDSLYYNKTNLKGITVQDLCLQPPKAKDGKETRGLIFINEGLTPENKAILYEARRKGKELNYKVWTVKGTVKIKGYHHPKPTILNSIEDVKNLN